MTTNSSSTLLPQSSRQYQLFRHCGRTFAVNTTFIPLESSTEEINNNNNNNDNDDNNAESNSNDDNTASASDLGYVLKTDIEQELGIILDIQSTRFNSNKVVLYFERDSSLTVLTPERIHCTAFGEIIDIEDAGSMAVSALTEFDAISLAHSISEHYQNSPESPLTTLDRIGTDAQQRRGPQEHRPHTRAMQSAVGAFRKHPVESRRLALILDKADNIMSQRFEFCDNQLPQLFVVLPDPKVEWNSGSVLENHFKIHFLCECGQDSEFLSTHLDQSGSSGGYSIRRPEKFFHQFGPFLLVMLEVLRLGISVGGHRVEPLEIPEQSAMQHQIECSLLYLETFRLAQPSSSSVTQLSTNPSFDHNRRHQELKRYLEHVESTDVQDLAKYIKGDGRDSFGGLFLARQSEGINTKWICAEHHQARLSSSEAAIDHLSRLSLANGGMFSLYYGLVKASPKSSRAAKELYAAIEAVKEVQELGLTLDWNQSYGDLIRLHEMITSTSVSAVRINLRKFTGPDLELDFRGRYVPILDLMQHSNIRSVFLQNINGFWDRSALSSNGSSSFTNLKMLRIGGFEVGNRPLMETIFWQAGNLEKLEIDTREFDQGSLTEFLDIVLKSRSEYHKQKEVVIRGLKDLIPLLHTTIPTILKRPPPQLKDKTLVDIIQEYGNQFVQIGFPVIDNVLMALVEATFPSVQKEFRLTTWRQEFKDLTISQVHLCKKIIAQSRLVRFGGFNLTNVVAEYILGVIQWQNLTTLELSFMDQDPTPAIESLYSHLGRASSLSSTSSTSSSTSTTIFQQPMVALQYLAIFAKHKVSRTTAMVLGSILSTFLLEKLFLDFDGPIEFWLVVMESIQYTNLDALGLQNRDEESLNQVQKVLDRIPKEAELSSLSLEGFGLVSGGHVEQMKKRGITLDGEEYSVLVPELFRETISSKK